MNPMLDPARSYLRNTGVILREADMAQADAIITDTLAYLGLSNVSTGTFYKAQEALDQLATMLAGWDLLEEYGEPHKFEVETCAVDPEWDDGTRTHALAINELISYLICLGLDHQCVVRHGAWDMAVTS